jgi:putative nucleotidyltransferase with HDIG domain
MVTGSRVGVARALAEVLLADLPDRWAHTVGVAARAAELSVTVAPDDREVLAVAAWLHDIGYSQRLRDSGFHALDGARHLERQGWPLRVAALVAHHSGAVFAADAHGLRDEQPDVGAVTTRWPNLACPAYRKVEVPPAMVYAVRWASWLAVWQMPQWMARAGGSTATARLIGRVRVSQRAVTCVWSRQMAAPQPAHTATALTVRPCAAQSKQFMA